MLSVNNLAINLLDLMFYRPSLNIVNYTIQYNTIQHNTFKPKVP